ncbi:hypothetical protein [Xanthomonas rydalmerensis]|uniref:Uncharacterized protein n=1 Tax=Xanthomonas rydalmerensis TaxID=3046274 RepID=A0ABZ0JNA1_9XANT|nr:hypothetical protein [Xanthomonas sp. DM-2023]WOS40515.1 hypothetical protein QN243_19315 [Xanthomonas sp. DM-2023]WOS44699.1 hypothetical protein QN242_19315 [Xanthomonas sp. DM-2023]WOS48879.1 hypothetical protein QN240_19315 [Xanthomonas sp. DM-2023]WOS53059.1 hypothetical protein QN244_19320 [Xanthomonas sp. DM-2023]WOS57243.1 hypothetical protein QN245_19315 [Xanthomonas sp. DM-2023]
MRIALVIAVAVASLWLLAAGSVAAPAGRQVPIRIVSVSIQYTYMGWGYVDERFHLVPARNGMGFIMRWTDNDGTRHAEQQVATDKVMALFAAARAPRIDRATGLGELQQRAMAAETITKIRNALFVAPNCSPLQQRQLRAAQANGDNVRGALEQIYREPISWTDDDPSMTVRIVLERGVPMEFYSQSQKPFMLSWIQGKPVFGRDEDMNGPRATWSLPLSDALAEILPATSPARKRLARKQLVTVLARNLERGAPTSCPQRTYRDKFQLGN